MTIPVSPPPCPRVESSAEAPECSRRLDVAESLTCWRREAEVGVLDTGRYRCRYFSWGRGPALVFVPGLCSDGLTFVTLMARLSRDFRCVGYDLPAGAGDGARLTGYRHDDFVADLLALLDRTRVGPCAVLGLSFGATVVLAALARAPGRFRRAVLQGGFARRPLAPAEVFASHWARYLPGRVGQVPLLGRLTRHVQYAPFRGRADDDWHYYLDCQGRTPLRAFAHRALLLHDLDLRARLAAVPHPVLLVSGDRDPLVARAYADELRRGLPSAAHAEIEGAGHHPHLSHPEVLAEVVRQFVI